MSRRALALPIAAVVVAAGLLAARVLTTAPPPPDRAAEEAPVPTYGSFTVDTASGALSLADLRGRAVVVYFGYTACPDFCPTTMATVAAAFRRLPPGALERATGLFVSVDPERDTPARLAAYAGYFHPAIRAGTATPRALEAIARDWGVAYRKAVLPGSGLSYAVDHTTQAFLVGPDGRLAATLPHGTSAADVARAVEAALGPSEGRDAPESVPSAR